MYKLVCKKAPKQIWIRGSKTLGQIGFFVLHTVTLVHSYAMQVRNHLFVKGDFCVHLVCFKQETERKPRQGLSFALPVSPRLIFNNLNSTKG